MTTRVRAGDGHCEYNVRARKVCSIARRAERGGCRKIDRQEQYTPSTASAISVSRPA